MRRRAPNVRLGYIRVQATAYFVFALLFMRALAINVGSTKPFVSLDTKSGLIPLPDFHFPNWIPLCLAFICIVVSLFFVSALFRTRWMPVALRVAGWLSIPFYSAMLASFVVAWLTGLNPLLSLQRPIFDIFYWVGWVLFLALSIHLIWTPIRRGWLTRPNTAQITGAWQKCSFAGLEVLAYTTGKRGLYFTDEKIQVTIELTNSTNKRLRGSTTFFYGFGPSGFEGRTSERVSFDLQPKGGHGDKNESTILGRLVAVQGNGIVGWSLQSTEESAIESETNEERVLRPANELSPSNHILYAFVSFSREFYQRVYIRQEQLMKLTVNLTKLVIFFALISVIVGIIQILSNLK